MIRSLAQLSVILAIVILTLSAPSRLLHTRGGERIRKIIVINSNPTGHDQNTTTTNNNVTTITITKNRERKLSRTTKKTTKSTRIIGGAPARPNEFPWYGIPARTYLCGASLIHPDIMLSAGHCAGSFVGGVLINITNQTGAGNQIDTVPVERYIVHPNYNDITFANDIMLIKLTRPPKTNIPLLDWNSNLSTPVVGNLVRAIGFGWTNYTQEENSDVLLKVDVKVVNFKTCAKQYANFTDGERLFPLQMFCAGLVGVGGKDACNGDSGGPLLSQKTQYNSKTKTFDVLNTVVGIISWGENCGRPDRMGVYTNVSNYRTWIRHTMCMFTDIPCSDLPNP